MPLVIRRKASSLRWRGEEFYRDLLFLIRNVITAARMPLLEADELGGLRLCGCRRADLVHVNRIYRTLNGGRTLDRKHLWLLSLTGRRLCLVARRQNIGPIGFTFFYFNDRDRLEDTVHEGFIGVLPEFQGQKVGSAMRRRAIIVFAGTGLKGISSRISISNKASLDLSLQLGFKIVDRYIDLNTGEERAYLKLIFRQAANDAHST